MNVLITGACGQCGSALFELPHENYFFDRETCPENLEKFRFIQGDLTNPSTLSQSVNGCKKIIHLAAASKVNSSWLEVLHDNIIGTKNLLDIAKAIGVERVIFASTNHVVGMYEIENAPDLYELGKKAMITRDAEIRPDSLYAVSKAFGENLGRLYAESGGPKFYAIRIGVLVDEDHPYALADRGVRAGKWKKDSPQYNTVVKRQKALWISKRDFRHLVDLCLTYQGPSFDIFYGVSDNPRRWLDIEYARSVLGYQPQDNAENWQYSQKDKKIINIQL